MTALRYIILQSLLISLSYSLSLSLKSTDSMPSMETIEREFNKEFVKMKNGTKLLVLICKDIEDIEVVTIVTILKKAKVRYISFVFMLTIKD